MTPFKRKADGFEHVDSGGVSLAQAKARFEFRLKEFQRQFAEQAFQNRMALAGFSPAKREWLPPGDRASWKRGIWA